MPKPSDVVELLDKNYDETHGVVNVRRVVDHLLSSSKDAFGDISESFYKVDSRWHLPILEAMRVLAATGKYTEQRTDQVTDQLFKATATVATESGMDDEYFKSVNAVIVSPRIAPALGRYIEDWLNRDGSFFRELAFYTSGMLLDRNMNEPLKRLRSNLQSAAQAENSPQLKSQFDELLKQV
jgi:hypothetical protein